MTDWLRRAGSGRLPDGAVLTWSLAEGRRGRRWRAVAVVDGGIGQAVLVEVAQDGRPGRLELTTPAGLLTLHPSADGRTAHGNVVAADGVRPLVFGWSPEHAFDVVGRPIAVSVTLHRLAGELGVGESRSVPALAIAADLAVEAAVGTVWITSSGGRVDRRKSWITP